MKAVVIQEIMTGTIIDDEAMLGITIVIPQNLWIQQTVDHDGHIDHCTTVSPRVKMIQDLDTDRDQFELGMRLERDQVIPGTPRMITWMAMAPVRSIMRKNSSDATMD